METILEYPDEALDSLQLSLTDYVSMAQTLFLSGSELGQDPNAFIQFVLAGRLHFLDRDLRISINAKQGALPPPSGRYKLFGDLDSVIGVTRDLPFKQTFAIFPLPSFRDTLTKDNHVTYQLPGGFKVSFHERDKCTFGHLPAGRVRCFTPQNPKHASGQSRTAACHTNILSPTLHK